MKSEIRMMTRSDAPEVMDMMRAFYSSAAVFTNGSDEIFTADIANCLNDNPYIEGYIFCDGEKVLGYAMIAKSFSTEFGKPCIWIEDIYLKEEYRGIGIGHKFFDYITKKYDGHIFRLEVEEENETAKRLYEKCGFSVLPYMEMKK
jgi:ribosomal protein S18 acetylase RimI-like enzyme